MKYTRPLSFITPQKRRSCQAEIPGTHAKSIPHIPFNFPLGQLAVGVTNSARGRKGGARTFVSRDE